MNYLLPIYKKANKYPHLLYKWIAENPERIGLRGLLKKLLPIVAYYYLSSSEKEE